MDGALPAQFCPGVIVDAKQTAPDGTLAGEGEPERIHGLSDARVFVKDGEGNKNVTLPTETTELHTLLLRVGGEEVFGNVLNCFTGNNPMEVPCTTCCNRVFGERDVMVLGCQSFEHFSQSERHI